MSRTELTSVAPWAALTGGSRSFWVALTIVVAGATHACDRGGPPAPPAIEPVPASVHEPASQPEPEPEPLPQSEPEPDSEPAVACTRDPAHEGAPIEPVETWAASGPPPKQSVEQVEQVCTGREDRARRAIDDLGGPCETADDCELVRIACPFGCTRAVSKQADRRRARIAFDRYMDECPTCKDKCPALPLALVCQDGTCRASAEAPAPPSGSACPDRAG